MKIFFSWSGTKSKKVADVLTGWIPMVIQAVEPWISAELDKGTRWQSEISAKLEEAKFSIICLTRDNLKAPWILFEAGALSKSSNSNVCTFLFDVAHNDVEFPLAQFQHTRFSEDDVKRLLFTINRQIADLGERALSDTMLEQAFATYWPQLDRQLNSIATQNAEESEKPLRTPVAMMEETLELVRQLIKMRNSSTITVAEVGVPLLEGLVRSAGFPTTWPTEAERRGTVMPNAAIGTTTIRKFLAELRAAQQPVKMVSDEEFARGPISSPPPGHNDSKPPAQDGEGLVSPAGRLRKGVWLYLDGERLAEITGLTLENPFTGAAERGVLFNYQGREDYRPEWAVIRNFRVRENGL